jgi:hypothetical protein
MQEVRDHIVFLAKGEDVPTLIVRAVLLDMGAHFGFVQAILDRAIFNRPPADIDPMLKPTSAFTVIAARAVDINNFHKTPKWEP